MLKLRRRIRAIVNKNKLNKFPPQNLQKREKMSELENSENYFKKPGNFEIKLRNFVKKTNKKQPNKQKKNFSRNKPPQTFS